MKVRGKFLKVRCADKSFLLPLIFLIGILVVAYMPGTSFAQGCMVTDNYQPIATPIPPNAPPFKILAFGTSLMWGNGLTDAQTFRHQVADWLSDQTKRPVVLTTFAHSGALLTRASQNGIILGNPALSVGDLNSSLPTVEEQIDCAMASKTYNDAALILIEGCINDVGAEEIAYPWTDGDSIETNAREWCSRMAASLKKISKGFPRAKVVVVGYYPLVSYESPIFGFLGTRRLAKHASKIHADTHPLDLRQAKQRRPRKEERGVVADNSETFYQISKDALMNTVKKANEDNPDSFFYAGLPEIREPDGTLTVDPDWAFGAPDKHQWNIPIRILFFWAIFKDDKYWFRQPLCRQYVHDPVDELVCDSNTAFHPNVPGAIAYALSIRNAIPQSLVQLWKEALIP